MSRSRPLQRLSTASSTSNSSSSSTSPERGADDDNDSFMLQPNDSASSLGIDAPELSQNASARLEYEERCRVSPVHRLPAELLISIFARLSAPKDLQTCMLVSQEWARNSVGLLWHRPAMNKWESIHSVVQSIRRSSKFFAYQDLVKRLNMSHLGITVSDGTLIGMTQCKRIERLTLTHCAKLTDISLQPLIDGNRSLLALDVTGLDQLTDRTMMTVADHCLRLQGLNLTGCKKVTDASIIAVAKNCRHLKRLKFNHCPQLTDISILTVAAHCPHLLEIDLHSLQNLESPAVTALLTSCPHLREMRLAHCTRLNDSAFLDIRHEPELPLNFESLRILDLTDCGELGDKGVQRIVHTCPRLRNLILAKCRQITDTAVFAITKLGKNLHYIHLGHCARITDLSVEALAKSCTRIRYIDLACCSNLTDHSVTRLAGLPKLKRIGLVKCAGITDRSIYALAMGDAKGKHRMNGISVLERVHLSYCTLLTLDGIHVLLNNCPKLTHLSLTGVQAFLREELLAYCREAPSEFDDRQRDVFCVFSGPGVARVREFLNEQKAHALATASSATPSVAGDDDDDDDAASELSDARSSTPVMGVDVASQFPPGGTPVVGAPSPGPGSSSGVLFAAGGGQVGWNHGEQLQRAFLQHHYATHGGGDDGQHVAVGPAPINLNSNMNLSQSAPTITYSHSSAQWVVPAGPEAGPSGGGVILLPHEQQQQCQQPQPPPPMQGGSAQHVTGMMGAAILDDVDEGDEAFGEGSESTMD